MRLRSCLLVALLGLTFSISCKKDPQKVPPPVTVQIAEKSYATVKIGNQTWITSNFDGAGGVVYDALNSKPEYGKYYTFAEIKAIQLPAGWRIPTVHDYVKLAESQGVVFTNLHATRQEAIKKLTSKTNWKNLPGNNLSGFNAYPAGYIFQTSLPQDGDISEFWTAEGKTMSIQEGANSSLRITFYDNSSSPEYRFNVRFVKDNN